MQLIPAANSTTINNSERQEKLHHLPSQAMPFKQRHTHTSHTQKRETHTSIHTQARTYGLLLSVIADYGWLGLGAWLGSPATVPTSVRSQSAVVEFFLHIQMARMPFEYLYIVCSTPIGHHLRNRLVHDMWSHKSRSACARRDQQRNRRSLVGDGSIICIPGTLRWRE